MRRQRGSAILFVVVFMVAITTVLVAAAGLSSNAIKVQTRREEAAIALNAFDGAVDQVVSDFAKGALALPNTRTATIGSQSVSITVTDNGSVITRTLKVDGSMTINGRSYTFSRVVGQHKTPNPLYYAIALDRDFTTTFAVVTGSAGANGDMYVDGTATFVLAGTTINGDLETTGLLATLGIDVRGSITQNTTAIPFATPTRANYQAAATTLLAGGSTVNGFTFASAGAGPYKILYVNGNATIRGTFTGQGCVYIAGTATISADMAYGSAASEVVFIAEGGFQVGATTANIAGYFYTVQDFQTIGPTSKVVTRGGIACERLILGVPLTVNGDPWIWNTPTEGTRLRIPGLWP